MQQSKLIKHLTTLSKKERERFRLFVISPYFNQHQKTIELLELIYDHLERPIDIMPTKKELFNKLFSGQQYDEQQVHNILSYLKKIYHKYLAQRHFEESTLLDELHTVEQAYDLKQYDLMNNRAKQLEKKLKQSKHRNSEYYHTNYRMNHVLGFYYANYIDRTKSETLQKMLFDLDNYFLIEKLKNCCHLVANSILLNTKYDYGLFNELVNYVETNKAKFDEDPVVIMYYTILMSLLDERNEKHYEDMKAMLNEKIASLSDSDANLLYSFSYNYCIRQINQGKVVYQRELFQLYQKGLENGLLLPGGIISEWDYKNVITLGSKLKEFDWTEDFIESYKEKLPIRQKENAYRFNLANFYYNQKKYEDTLHTLQHVQFTDVKYHLNTTFLILRSHYDLKNYESSLATIDTLRVYVLRSKKMTSDQKKEYTNFLRLAKKLVQIQINAQVYTKKKNQEKISSLFQKIQQSDNVINKIKLINCSNPNCSKTSFF
ncbi:MAG: hypothetical protein AAFO07_18510, partial [Bacteroidota bacterium]